MLEPFPLAKRLLLILSHYYYQHEYEQFFTQILFALYEKNIKFTAYEVDVTSGEQYSQWFLELNPKGEVPVLQDGTLVVPESGRIISYIEDHYQGGKILLIYHL